jgi:hypothetical protein
MKLQQQNDTKHVKLKTQQLCCCGHPAHGDHCGRAPVPHHRSRLARPSRPLGWANVVSRPQPFSLVNRAGHQSMGDEVMGRLCPSSVKSFFNFRFMLLV